MQGAFHSHTTFSDGRLSVEQLLKKFKSKQFTHLAITDHDNAGAFPAAFDLAKDLGLSLYAGLEFSSQFKKISECHILGLRIDYNHPDLKAYEKRILGSRKIRAKKIIQKIKEMGVLLEPETEQELYNNPSIGRPHIAKILVDKKVVRSIDEAFDSYLMPGKSLYIAKDQFTAEEVISLIQRIGGISVLAHPITTFSDDDVKELLGFGLNGIEVIHPHHKRKVSQKWREFATKNNMVISGGSDYHAITKSEEKNIIKYKLEGDDLKQLIAVLEK